MKKIAFLSVLVLITANSCKKEKQSTPVQQPGPSAQSQYMAKLNKTWICDGFNIYSSHPPDRNPAKTYTDTTDYVDKHFTIAVLDDTTIVAGGDTMLYFATDNVTESFEFIPKIFKDLGSRYRPDFVKYYFAKDSIHYLYRDYGVSFTTETQLHSK